MVRLTEEMVVARTRISDLTAVKRLNCWGTELTDVGILRNLKNVEVLSLSVNNIDTLADFQYCLNLQDLFVRKNNIKDLREICYLQGLPNLRNLWLDENPCAEQDGYRLTVLRALPNLDKLDDKVVTTEEIQNAQVRGRILFHPLNMDASPTHSETSSPEEVVADDYIDDSELVDQRRRYNASVDQHQQQATGFTSQTGRAERRTIREYQENDRRNANWSTSPTFQQHNYQQNNSYGYEILQNGQIRNDKTETEVMNPAESRTILDNYSPTIATSATTIATNSLGILKEYDDQLQTGESERSRRRRRHSSGNAGEDPPEQDHRRLYPYSDNGENDSINQRSSLDRQIETNAVVSPRTSYPPIDYSDERRSAAERRDCGIFNHEEEQQDRRQLSESDQQQPKRSSAASYHHHHHNNSIVDRDEAVNREREMAASQGGWVRHAEKEKCRFHYHRRPVTRNSNILSAVLCLVKELDYPSLEVVEMAVRNRMDELEE